MSSGYGKYAESVLQQTSLIEFLTIDDVVSVNSIPFKVRFVMRKTVLAALLCLVGFAGMAIVEGVSAAQTRDMYPATVGTQATTGAPATKALQELLMPA